MFDNMQAGVHVQKTVAKPFLRAWPKLQGVRFTLHFSCSALRQDNKVDPFFFLRFTFSSSFCVPAPTVGFVYYFICYFPGAADGQTSEWSHHFTCVKQQRGTEQAVFSCHHFEFGCSRNRPTKKSKLVLISSSVPRPNFSFPGGCLSL